MKHISRNDKKFVTMRQINLDLMKSQNQQLFEQIKFQNEYLKTTLSSENNQN